MYRTPIIKTNGLHYSYSKDMKTIVDVNLLVERGSIYGFLGPNGSGKTTTLSLLLGLMEIQQGTIEIFGQEINSARIEILRKIGSLIEAPSLYGHLTAKENLEVYRNIYGASKQRVNEVLKIAGLDDTGNKTAKKFSLGMKQRLAIALALLPKPELLILDEPSNGLDPNGIIELRELLRRLNKEEGITILISSHILSEVEKTVTHVGIISKGRMLFQGSMQQLNLVHQKDVTLTVCTSDNDYANKILQQYNPQILEDLLKLSLTDREQVADVARTLVNNGVDIYVLRPEESNLEQLFSNLISNHI